MTAAQRSARVLVVDDEPAVSDLYATWLAEDHDVETVTDGDLALSLLDDSYDVAFLDRRMPGLSGDELLETIAERGVDCRVVMVTAVDPGFDLVDMPIDDYLVKPVSRDELVDSVAEMLVRDAYDARMREYFALASKKAAIESGRRPAELDGHEGYAALTRRLDELAVQVDDAVARSESVEGLFRDLGDE